MNGTKYIQQATQTGWNLYRAGIPQHFTRLSYALAFCKGMGYAVIVLNKSGERMN